MSPIRISREELRNFNVADAPISVLPHARTLPDTEMVLVLRVISSVCCTPTPCRKVIDEFPDNTTFNMDDPPATLAAFVLWAYDVALPLAMLDTLTPLPAALLALAAKWDMPQLRNFCIGVTVLWEVCRQMHGCMWHDCAGSDVPPDACVKQVQEQLESKSDFRKLPQAIALPVGPEPMLLSN